MGTKRERKRELPMSHRPENSQPRSWIVREKKKEWLYEGREEEEEGKKHCPHYVFIAFFPSIRHWLNKNYIRVYIRHWLNIS